ncbi:MAG: PAS domain-containing protein, partial [Planctomycetaceae bacterium]|nr:PAS domain-containing protein [Planctomycetaceae bacterium]
RISEACDTLIQTAREISRGNIRRRSTVERNDELGVLSSEFNRMMTTLADQLDQEQEHSRKLRAGSDRLTTVLGAMIEGVIAVDEQQKILFANRAARRLLDLADEDCEGRLIWATIRITAVHNAIRDVFAGEPHRQLEFELTRKKATVSMLASRLPGNPCPGLVLVLHDITDLRRLENMRREFVSNVSHELKTPLTSIRAFTETLLEGAVDDPDHNRRFLQRIEGQSERLSLLIQDLLNLARIESGRESFDVVPLRVADSVRNCIDARQPVAAGKGVELKVGSSPQDAFVSADSDGLRTILDNLISNAINYTPSGGRVEVRWLVEGDRVLLQVQDTGVGIPPEHHGRIFERFYRVDKARSREVGGTGLGLSIVKHLVAVFNGTIQLQSTPGSGSTFTVSLPAGPRRQDSGPRPERQ